MWLYPLSKLKTKHIILFLDPFPGSVKHFTSPGGVRDRAIIKAVPLFREVVMVTWKAHHMAHGRERGGKEIFLTSQLYKKTCDYFPYLIVTNVLQIKMEL